MRYDVEIVLSKAVVDLLGSLMDSTLACKPSANPTAKCLIVDFTDPMSIDDANRITVMVPQVNTNLNVPSEFTARVEVIAKSLWKKPTLAADYAAHSARVNELRDKLCPVDLAARLAAKMPAGATLDFVSPKRDYSTRVYENGWINSEAVFSVSGHFTN